MWQAMARDVSGRGTKRIRDEHQPRLGDEQKHTRKIQKSTHVTDQDRPQVHIDGSGGLLLFAVELLRN